MEKKKLYKIEEGRKILGVCGGIAEYFDVDPVFVRVGWGFLTLFWGAGIILYLICAFAFPNKSEIE